MNSNRNSAYDERFYREHMDGSYRSAVTILKILHEFYTPASVIDFGCGLGTWLRAAKELGSGRILGLDGSHVDQGLLLIDPHEFSSIDLEHERPTLGERFDLAMSLEVAEHLPRSRAEGFVEDICRASDTVLFAAAVPGQGGTHHVNEQFPSFWTPLFSNCGFRCFDVIRPRVWDDSDVRFWYRQNTLIYSRSDMFSGVTPQWQGSDLVHPELFRKRLRSRALSRRIRAWMTRRDRS